MSEKLYSTAEVAEMLGTSDAHIRMILSRHPELAPRKIGRAWVWTEKEIERLRNRDKEEDDKNNEAKQ